MLAPLLAALVLAQAPPETTIVSGPAGVTNAASPTFAFTASDAAATFQCDVDDAGFTACVSPFTAPPLSDGSHTFSVRAVSAGTPDATPATIGFAVQLPATAMLRGRFTSGAQATAVKSLTLSGVPRGGTVTATCRGRGCPFHGPKTFKAKSRVAKLTDAFKPGRLRSRAVVEITVAAPGATGKRFRLTFRTPPLNPRTAILCLPPGGHPTDCGGGD